MSGAIPINAKAITDGPMKANIVLRDVLPRISCSSL